VAAFAYVKAGGYGVIPGKFSVTVRALKKLILIITMRQHDNTAIVRILTHYLEYFNTFIIICQ
jgi:hypothetical protein